MARSVTVNKKNVTIDNQVYQTGDVVTVTDAQFNSLTNAGAFGGGSPTLTDGGAAANPGDNVYTQGATVAAPTALTSAAASGGEAPTEAEYNALRTDVSNLRTTVANLLTALKGAGKPLAP